MYEKDFTLKKMGILSQLTKWEIIPIYRESEILRSAKKDSFLVTKN